MNRRTADLFPRPLIMAMALSFLPPALAPALADGVCGIDIASLDQSDGRVRTNYNILSDISCDAPTVPAHVLLCASAESPDPTLWRMVNLDDAAWVYAYENATGTETNHDNPPRDDGFIAARDACTTEACLCEVLIEHTNASLGGESPYPQ